MCSLSHSLALSLSRLLAHLITRSVAHSPTRPSESRSLARPSESRSLALLLTRSLAHSLFRSLVHSLNPLLSCCSLPPALPLSPDDLLSRCLARALGCRFAAPTVMNWNAPEKPSTRRHSLPKLQVEGKDGDGSPEGIYLAYLPTSSLAHRSLARSLHHVSSRSLALPL